MTIIIIIIAFKGAIRDFLQSPHSAANCLEHTRSSGPGAIVCKSRATHRALITCKCHVTCHLVRRDSSAIKFDWVESNLFELILLTESLNRWRGSEIRLDPNTDPRQRQELNQGLPLSERTSCHETNKAISQKKLTDTAERNWPEREARAECRPGRRWCRCTAGLPGTPAHWTAAWWGCQHTNICLVECTHAHTHTHTHIHTNTHKHTSTHTWHSTQGHALAYIGFTQIQKHTHSQTHRHTLTQTPIELQLQVHTHTHTHTDTRTHTQR